MSSPTNPESDPEKSHAQANSAVPGFSRAYEDARDENLPEVYVDDSPQAIMKHEGQNGVYDEVQSPKFSIPCDDSPKTAVPPSYEAVGDLPPGASAAADSSPSEDPDASKNKASRICGMSRKMFFIVLAVLLVVIIAAAVGGGVGGAVASSASKSGSSENSNNSNPTATSGNPTSTSDSLPSSTSSETASPTAEFLNNGTIVTDTFAFQGFSDTDYDGKATKIFSKESGIDFDYAISSYVWAPQDTGCCLSFCQNTTDKKSVGWLCSARKQPKASDKFHRVFVWCGKEQSAKNAICHD